MSKNRIIDGIKYSILVVSIGVTLQYIILTVMGVSRRYAEVEEAEDAKLIGADVHTSAPEQLALFQKKVWLESRLQMARNDEICLKLDLSDSVLQLELKGVVLKTSKISHFHADQFFYRLSPGGYYHLFATQVQADTCFATISQKPIVVKKSTEARLQDQSLPLVDSLKNESVHWILNLDNGIVLQVEGNDQFSLVDWKGWRFWVAHELIPILERLQRTVCFQVPDYKPSIKVVISEGDAKAIYRALPPSPVVGIRF